MDAKRKENVTPEDFGLSGDSVQKARYFADFMVAAERERLRVLVEAVRDANRDEQDGDTFRLLNPGQEQAWLALLAGLKGPNVGANRGAR